MRLSTDESRDEQLALQTIAAAAEAGITVFDTAHSYGRGEHELGHNERLLARALRRCGAAETARIVTKGEAWRGPRARGSRTAARRRFAPTARPASSRSTACRSTCI